jgi:predicted ATPase
MFGRLTNFCIYGLHGDMDVEISLKDNRLVIVAENGMGKTTIVNIIYYTLSRQWLKLTEYAFERISFNINDNTFTIECDELNAFVKLRKLRNRRVLRNENSKLNYISNQLLDNYDVKALVNDRNALHSVSEKLGVPTPVLLDICLELTHASNTLFTENLENIGSVLAKEFGAQILYLPTYRRIEKDLKSIFPDLETNLDSIRNSRAFNKEDESKMYIELVEFGMEDVQKKVEQKLNSLYINFTNNLRNSLMGGYLKDILNKNYEKYDFQLMQSISLTKLLDILKIIDSSLLDDKEKELLVGFVRSYLDKNKTNNEDKIVAYFIQKLINIYETQSVQEKDVISFVETCNAYCNNKEFIYVREERKIKIYLNDPRKEITFSKLSSGEKQIVSLFSHLYLSENKNFFVIIDEPELSLSVTWQEMLLPDILRAYNVGLIAVTHSPFIFSNEFDKYTKSFNEFIKIRG